MASNDGIRPPERFNFDGDVAAEWPLWKEEFDNYLIAREADVKADKVKIALFLNALGPEGVRRLKTIIWARMTRKYIVK